MGESSLGSRFQDRFDRGEASSIEFRLSEVVYQALVVFIFRLFGGCLEGV